MKQSGFLLCPAWIFAVLVSAGMAHAQTTRPTTARTASLQGRVIAMDGKPIAGATVKAYNATRLFRLTPLASEPSNLDGGYPFFGSTTTDADGRFHIDAPVLVQVIVAVQASGCGIVLEQCATDGLDDPLMIQLAPAVPARVRVTDINGRPVANAHIAPTHIDSTNNTYLSYLPNELAAELAQTSDASGMCTFPGFPESRRIVYKVLDDHYTALGILSRPRPDAQPGDVENFQIDAGGVIEGQVIFSDTNEPAVGMTVLVGEMIGTNGRWSTSVTTDKQGKFRLAHLREGDVQLVPCVKSPISSQYTATIATVPINPPQTVTGLQLLLVHSPTSVRGQVTSLGQPVAGVVVHTVFPYRSVFDDSSLPHVSEATTAADGSYELMLMPGQYRLTASAADRLNLFALAPQDLQITLTDQNSTSADFQFQPGTTPPLGKVEGTVVDEQDHPIAGAAIVGVVARPIRGGGMNVPGNIARQMAAVLHAASDADGNFTLDMIGPYVELYARKGDTVLAQPLNIGADTPHPKLVLKQTSGTLMVHALQADGKPVAGATVRVGISYDWRRFAPVLGMTGADGTFAVRPFFPDRRYSVTVSAEDFANASGDFGTSRPMLQWLMAPGAAAPAPKIIDPGQTLDATMRMLRTDSFIAGEVVDASGAPLAGVTVNARLTRGTSSYTSRTDASGRFRIDKLVAGEQLTITTSSVGGRSGQSTPVVAGIEDLRIVHIPSTPIRGGIPSTNPAGRGAR